MKKFKDYTWPVYLRFSPHHMVNTEIKVELNEATRKPVISFKVERSEIDPWGEETSVIVSRKALGCDVLAAYIAACRIAGSTNTDSRPIMTAVNTFCSLYEEKA